MSHSGTNIFSSHLYYKDHKFYINLPDLFRYIRTQQGKRTSRSICLPLECTNCHLPLPLYSWSSLSCIQPLPHFPIENLTIKQCAYAPWKAIQISGRRVHKKYINKYFTRSKKTPLRADSSEAVARRAGLLWHKCTSEESVCMLSEASILYNSWNSEVVFCFFFFFLIWNFHRQCFSIRNSFRCIFHSLPAS